MEYIESVLGPLKNEEMGSTLVHEHMKVCSEEVAFQFPHLYDSKKEFLNAYDQVKKVKNMGISTIFDPSVMGLGRDIKFIHQISKETNINIIAATGIYTFNDLPPHFQNRDIDYMADLFVRELTVGIQNTDIKAGFLKCATDYYGVTPDVEKVIRAVARAHKRTGVPIMTHSHPGKKTGIDQINLLKEEGVEMNKVLIGHTGDTEDIDYILEVLSHGVYIGMDRYGIIQRLSTEARNKTLLKVLELGYANKVFLSQDYCCNSDWFTSEVFEKRKDWSMSMILENVIPTLLENGVTQNQVDQMMINNVQEWCS